MLYTLNSTLYFVYIRTSDSRRTVETFFKNVMYFLKPIISSDSEAILLLIMVVTRFVTRSWIIITNFTVFVLLTSI